MSQVRGEGQRMSDTDKAIIIVILKALKGIERKLQELIK
jgi:hypothetical protein